LTNFDELFIGVGRVTGTSWLDFGVDPDHGAESGIFEGIFIAVFWQC